MVKRCMEDRTQPNITFLCDAYLLRKFLIRKTCKSVIRLDLVGVHYVNQIVDPFEHLFSKSLSFVRFGICVTIFLAKIVCGKGLILRRGGDSRYKTR